MFHQSCRIMNPKSVTRYDRTLKVCTVKYSVNVECGYLAHVLTHSFMFPFNLFTQVTQGGDNNNDVLVSFSLLPWVPQEGFTISANQP